MSVHIGSEELNRVVLQYLREAGFNKAAMAMQEESGVFLNSTAYPAQLQVDLRGGKWERVLHELQFLDCPHELVQDIFEQIFYDLLEQGAARDELLPFLDQAAPFATDGLRRHKLLQLVDQPSTRPSTESRKESRRVLAEMVGKFLGERKLSSSRLVSLMEDLARTKSSGLVDLQFNLVTGEVRTFTQDKPLDKLGNIVELPTNTEITAMTFTADGRHIVFGSQDGLIELFSARSFVLDDVSLPHQKSGDFFFHAESVTALASAADLLASGDASGLVKLWSLKRGNLIVESPLFKGYSVLSLEMLPDGDHLLALSAQRVKVVRLSDLVCVEDYCILSSPSFTAAAASAQLVFVGAAEGLVHVFDRTSGQLQRSFKPPCPTNAKLDEERTIKQIVVSNGDLFILTRGAFLAQVTQEGKFVDLHCNEDRDAQYYRFVRGAHFAYVVGETKGKATLWVSTKDTWDFVHHAYLPSLTSNGPLVLHPQHIMLAVGVRTNAVQIVT